MIISEESSVYEQLIEQVSNMQAQSATNLLVELIQKMPEDEQQVLLTDLKTRSTRRGKTRHIVFNEVAFSVRGQEYKAIMQDISITGLFLETSDTFPIGTTISMVIPFSNSENKITTEGEVVRIADHGIGIRFNKTTKIQ